MKILFKITSVFALLGLVLASGCSAFGSQATETPEPIDFEQVNPMVNATGVVAPERYTTLSMSTAGVVAEVFVRENEVVKAGQPLVRLEGQENLQAAVAAARLEVAAAQYDLDRLNKDLDVRAAEANREVVEARKALRDAERRIRNLELGSEQTDIDQARANVAIAEDKMEEAREDYEPYERKPESNLVRAGLLSKKAQAEKDYERAVRLLNNLLSGANDLDLAEAQAELELAKTRLAAAERNYEILQVGPDPLDLKLAEERFSNAQAQLGAAEAALKYLELKAPFDGTVSELNIRQNEWIAPGQPLMLLADLSGLRVQTTDLNEIDVARIQEGSIAIVTFDALPEVSLQCSVLRIATKASSGSGVNYTVVLELPGIPDRLRWGMTAFVDIEVPD